MNNENQASQVVRESYATEQVTPTPNQPDNIRHIEIDQLNHGYIVVVGCHRFAVESAPDLISKLSQYIFYPQKTEALWFEKKLF